MIAKFILLALACVPASWPTGARAQPLPADFSDCGSTAPAGTGKLDAVPQSRLHTLGRGVNVVTALDVTRPPEVVAAEFRLLRRTGLRHLRIPVPPERLVPMERVRSGPTLERLDRLVCEALRADLGVIIDMHPSGRLGARDENADAVAPELGAAWLLLATHFRRTSPERIFFEVLNEPGLTDPAAWGRMQEGLLRRIRSVAPNHTVLLTGSPTSTAWALATMAPSADRNVAYVFHFYTPMVFTHQGAEWDSNGLTSIRALAYPPDPRSVAASLARADPRIKPQIAAYGEEFTSDARLRQEIFAASGWARQHKAALVVTEFGVYRRFATTPSRAAWLGQVRRILQGRDIGWTVWELDAGFGIRADLEGGCVRTGPVIQELGLCASP